MTTNTESGKPNPLRAITVTHDDAPRYGRRFGGIVFVCRECGEIPDKHPTAECALTLEYLTADAIRGVL